ncbi:MAG: methyl-accepting chemotaxis protein [bacterium]
MKIRLNPVTLKSKLLILSVAVFISITALLLTSLLAFKSYDSSSDKLLEAFSNSRKLNEIGAELSRFNNIIALQLIDGERREIINDLEDTLIYQWLNDEAKHHMNEEKRVQFLDKWKEYFELIQKTHRNVTDIDQTLSEYLAYTHEQVFRVKIGENSGLKKLSFYRWINDEGNVKKQHPVIQDAFEKLRKNFNRVASLESKGEVPPGQYRNLMYAIEAAKDSVYNVQSENEKFILIFKNRLQKISDEMFGMLNEVRSGNIKNETMRRERQQSLSENIVVLLTTITVIFLIMFFVIVFFMGNSILKPVYKTREKLRDLSKKGGDLRMTLPVVSDDEIGKMTSSVNDFIIHLRKIVNNVKDASVQLDTISENISQGSEGASSRISDVSDSVESISGNLSEITSRLKKTTEEMQNVSNVVVKLSRHSDSSSKMLGRALSSMNEIQSANTEIQEITEVVDEIAFQTNLLSLNAAIEAARAGEYGKGFAVVAKEVRQLSRRSSKSAQQINSLLKNTGSKITAGVMTLNETNSNFTKMLDEFRKIFNDITKLSEELKTNTSEVSSVDKDISTIQSTLNNNAAYVEEVASSTQGMSHHTKLLLENMKKFKVD